MKKDDLPRRTVTACAQSKRMVSRYLLGELFDAELEIFIHHMNSCAVCQKGVRDGKRFVQGIKDIGGK